MKKISYFVLFILILIFYNNVYASITEEQADAVAEYAKEFIEQGNNRRDEKGYPLLTYAIRQSATKSVEIRNSGYNEKLFHVNNISFYSSDLGNKWCMDCGTFITFIFKKTLGLELYNDKVGEPWHISDMYNDANKKENSNYFEFVYKSVAVKDIDYSKLKKGDVIVRVTSGGNHGMLYVGDELIAHTNGDLISRTKPYIFGFRVMKLSEYYSKNVKLNVLRIKDGAVPTNLKVNSYVTWPDTNETVNILAEYYAEKYTNDIKDCINNIKSNFIDAYNYSKKFINYDLLFKLINIKE